MTTLQKPSFNGSASSTTKLLCKSVAKNLNAGASICRIYDSKAHKYMLVGRPYFDLDYLREEVQWQVPLEKGDVSYPGASGLLAWGSSEAILCDFENIATGEEEAFLRWAGRKAWFPISTPENDFLVVAFRGKEDAIFSRDRITLGWVNSQVEIIKRLSSERNFRRSKNAPQLSAYVECVNAIVSALENNSFALDSLGDVLSSWKGNLSIVHESSSDCLTLLPSLRDSYLPGSSACDLVRAASEHFSHKYPIASRFNDDLHVDALGTSLICPVYLGKEGNVWIVESHAPDSCEDILLTSIAAYLGTLIGNHESAYEYNLEQSSKHRCP